MSAERNRSNTQTIAVNSFWRGAEVTFELVTVFATSIPLARVIGPENLGYFTLVMWLTNMTGLIGSLGIPSTTRKFMAEYLGAGQPGIVRAVFFRSLRQQIFMGTALALAGVGLVLRYGDPRFQMTALLQVVSILPAMATFVPSQANNAREDLRANIAGSLTYNLIHITAVWLSLVRGFGLQGVALGILIGRTSEFTIRTLPLFQWARRLPIAEIPSWLRKEIRKFSVQGTALLVLTVVVWDRSDMLMLKALGRTASELSFFSLCFSLTANAVILPQVLGASLGATMMAQYGRNPERLINMTSSGLKYMLMGTAPLLFGLAFLSPSLIGVVYGKQYYAAVPTLAVAASLGLFKPLLGPAQQILQAHRKQAGLIAWVAIGGGVNLTLDWLLIPIWGATGAAVGNGVGQAGAVIGTWFLATRTFRLELPGKAMVRILLAALAMGFPVIALTCLAPKFVAVLVGPIAGAFVFGIMLKLLRVLTEEDLYRFSQALKNVPAPFRSHARDLVCWLGNA